MSTVFFFCKLSHCGESRITHELTSPVFRLPRGHSPPAPTVSYLLGDIHLSFHPGNEILGA